MCGLCGIVNFQREEPVDLDLLREMTSTLKHRGPDDEGFYHAGFVGLGHRRLSIIDLSTGRQPIHNEEKSVWVVFNGEIYNAPELTSQLADAGHRFYTQTDTEVILHAYEDHGVNCLTLFNGMFAFALWDSSRRRLVLARDRAGIKPLYYTEVNGVFIFGSELKALVKHPLVEKRLDVVALNQYLSFEYVPTPRSIFEGVKKLPPGCVLVLEAGRVTIEQYWDFSLERSEGGATRTEQDYQVGLRQTLREVVRKELLSDVPVGVLLSGGIDSSAVAAFMAELNPGGVQSFSIAFEDPSFDESAHARLVAETLGTKHHEMTLTAHVMLDLIPKIADFLDEPLGDSSIVPTYLLSKFAAEHVKVVLGGDGGDELFAGYSTLQAHRLADYYHRFVPSLIRNRVVKWAVERLPVSFDNISLDFKARRFVAGQDVPPALRHHIWLGSCTTEQKDALLGSLAGGHDNAIGEVLAGHLSSCRAKDYLNQILYCDKKLYLEGDILPKVDRASMANSLEVRVPLLNVELMEFAQALPFGYKLRGLTTKYLLRKSVSDLLPPRILKRGKKGFNMPVAKWLTGPLKSLTDDLFAEDRLRAQGLFNPSYVRSLLQEHARRRRDNRKVLWTLLVFQLWYERWAA